MSHKPNRPQQNPHPDPHKKSGEKESTNRHVYVEPGAKIDFVEDLRKKYDTAQQESTAHSGRVLFWTKASALLLFVYAGLTGYQDYLSRQQVKISERGSRPFIGPWTFTMQPEWLDKAGKWQYANPETPPPTRAEFQSVIKNFGPIPGENFRGWLDAYVGDKLLTHMNREQAPFTFFPSQTQEYRGAIDGDDFKQVVTEKQPLRLEITISYDYAEGHSYECREYRYVAGANQLTSFAPCKK